MTDLALDAHIRAEQAEEEATSLRLELKAAQARIISIKRITLDVCFGAELSDLRDEIDSDVQAFRARWGCDPR